MFTFDTAHMHGKLGAENRVEALASEDDEQPDLDGRGVLLEDGGDLLRREAGGGRRNVARDEQAEDKEEDEQGAGPGAGDVGALVHGVFSVMAVRPP